MFKLGEYQDLLIFRKTDFGYYLKEPDSNIDVDIFLPTRELDEDSQIGDIINVFVYRDSEDRLICTTTKPKLELGKLGLLKVSKIDEIGAFLDWGLRKDLLLPFSDQLYPVEEDDEDCVEDSRGHGPAPPIPNQSDDCGDGQDETGYGRRVVYHRRLVVQRVHASRRKRKLERLDHRPRLPDEERPQEWDAECPEHDDQVERRIAAQVRPGASEE